jgi:hypothetical protein
MHPRHALLQPPSGAGVNTHGMRNEILANRLYSAKRLYKEPPLHSLLADDSGEVPLHPRNQGCNEVCPRATSLEHYISRVSAK